MSSMAQECDCSGLTKNPQMAPGPRTVVTEFGSQQESDNVLARMEQLSVGLRPKPDLEPITKFKFAEYPSLPDHAQTEEYYYFLGWRFNSDLRARTKAYVTETLGKQDVFPWDEEDYYTQVLWEKLMKYPHSWLMLDPAVYETIGPHNADEPADSETEKLLMITSTHPVHYHEPTYRPTQAQYNFLVDLLGAEPTWYRDFFDKKDRDYSPSGHQLFMPLYLCGDCGKKHNMRMVV